MRCYARLRAKDTLWSFPQRKSAPKNVNSEVNSVRFISFQYLIHIDLIFYFAYVFFSSRQWASYFIRMAAILEYVWKVHAKFNFAVIWLSNPIDRVIEKPLHPFFVGARMRSCIKCLWLAFIWNRCRLLKQDSILFTYSSNKLYTKLILRCGTFLFRVGALHKCVIKMKKLIGAANKFWWCYSVIYMGTFFLFEF